MEEHEQRFFETVVQSSLPLLDALYWNYIFYFVVYSTRTRVVLYFAAVLLYMYSLLVKWNYIIGTDFIRSYLADFLFLPIVVPFTWRISQKILPYSNASYNVAILISLISVIFVFEVCLPTFSEIYISDWKDIVAYVLGGVIVKIEQSIYKRNAIF